MVITATYKNKMIERKRPALPLSPQRHVMFRGAYYIGGPAVPSEVLDTIAADAAFTKDVIECTCTQPVACCGKPFYAAPATVPDADALEKLRGRYPYLAFEAEPRWVSHRDLHGGYCGRRSQWATVLTITASADARSPTCVTTMTTEERACEARTERERALRAELDRAAQEAAAHEPRPAPAPGLFHVTTLPWLLDEGRHPERIFEKSDFRLAAAAAVSEL